MFLAVLMFLCMFFKKKYFYKDVKNMFFFVFYLQINVFNIYDMRIINVLMTMTMIIHVYVYYQCVCDKRHFWKHKVYFFMILHLT